LQRELTEHRENWRATEDRFQDTVAQERKEKDVLLAECEELRSQVMTPHRLELLKHQIAEDLARTHKEVSYYLLHLIVLVMILLGLR
jgi:hypothetical protein